MSAPPGTGGWRRCRRLGQKTVDNILRNIQFARTKDPPHAHSGRSARAAERIIAAMRERRPDIAAIAYAGSLRRFEETVGDVDIVCATDDAPGALAEFVALPQVGEVLGHGDTKASVLLDDELQVDFQGPCRRANSVRCSSTSPAHSITTSC